MRISIITVCYNSVETIASTILSVLHQTCKDFEYIIVDGGSTDGTLGVIKRYESEFNGNLIWISEPDNGLYDAMNKAIKMAKSELVGILNSDDTFYSKTTISDIISFHSQNNIEASVGNILQKNKTGKIIRFYTSKLWNPNKLKFGFMPPHPSIIFRRELFSKYGNYELSFKIAADYELITRFFLKYNITWKYSGITTTTMLIGGLSSSGYSSYILITKEIKNSLVMNGVKSLPLTLNLRFIWKIIDYVKALFYNNFQ